MYTRKTGFAPADFDPKTFITIPNMVTIVRLIILPFILILLNKGYNIWAGVLVVFCGFTDVLDGFLAKILNQATTIGKVLDPVVDKIFYLAIMIFLLFYRNFPLWGFIIIVVLEFLILTGSYILFTKYRMIPSSNTYGKIAVFLIALSVFFYVIDLDILKTNLVLEFSLQKIILILGIVGLFIAIFTYWFAAKTAIKESKRGGKFPSNVS
jgi:cardiolipin synthase